MTNPEPRRLLRPLCLGDGTCGRWSPDGELLAVGTGSGPVRLLRAASLRDVATLHAHDAQVIALTWSADGTTLASVSVDQAIAIWDARTVRLRRRITNAYGWFVALSRHGDRVAVSDSRQGTRVWDVATGEQAVQDSTDAADLCWGDDGRLWALRADGTLRDVTTGDGERPNDVSSPTTRAALAPNGTAAWTIDKHTVRVQRTDGTRRDLPFRKVGSIHHGPLGFVVTSWHDGTHLVDTTTLDPTPLLAYQRSWPHGEAVPHPSDDRVLALSDRGIAVFRPGSPTGEPIAAPARAGRTVVTDAMLAHVQTGEQVVVIDLEEGKVVPDVPAVRADEDSVYSNDGGTRVRMRPDVRIERVDGSLVGTAPDRLRTCTALSAGGRWLATGQLDGNLVVDDVVNGTVRAELPVQAEAVWFAPDAESLVVATRNDGVHAWRFLEGAATTRLQPTDPCRRTVAAVRRPDGTWVLLGRSPSELCVHAAGGERIEAVQLEATSPHRLVLSNDGERVAVVSRDSAVDVFDLFPLRARRVVGVVDGGWWTVDVTTGERDGNEAGLAALDEAERLAR